MKVSELTGAALDWAVAKCEGEEFRWQPEYNGIGMEFEAHHYSTDWAQGGPIMDREQITVRFADGFDVPGSPGYQQYYATKIHGSGTAKAGPTQLTAAMRCFVASRFGHEIDIPEELK